MTMAMRTRIHSTGYEETFVNGRYRHVHRIVAEQVLGKPLPDRAVVHHYGEKLDNSKIVICEDQAYHNLLHQRQRALDACGNPNWRKCPHCKTYDDPANMLLVTTRRGFQHVDGHQWCITEYGRRRLRRLREAAAQ